ncbi:MAG TPA: hypothetical protein VFZ25_18645 [Chloroflexota bacterium]|nr:hypothetical protein [Chloroflexota bacterium]
MPCIFCIAALAMVGAALAPAAIEGIDRALRSALPDARRSADSGTMTKWEGTYTIPGPRAKRVPVAVYIYKGSGRTRVQIKSHDVSRAEAEAIQDDLAGRIGAKVLAREFPDPSGAPAQQIPHRHDDDGAEDIDPQPRPTTLPTG